MFITVTVTARDIKYGKPSSPERCPVARACHRAGFPFEAVVTGMGVCVGSAQFILSDLVQNWIMDFDWGSPVSPIVFEIEVAESFLKPDHDQVTAKRKTPFRRGGLKKFSVDLSRTGGRATKMVGV
jgi:hypothetical protein